MIGRVEAFDWSGTDGATIGAHIGIGLAFCAVVACAVRCGVVYCRRRREESEPLLNEYVGEISIQDQATIIQINDEDRTTPYQQVALDALSPPPEESEHSMLAKQKFQQQVDEEKQMKDRHKATALARLDTYLEDVGKNEFTPTPIPNIPILSSPPNLAPTGYQQ